MHILKKITFKVLIKSALALLISFSQAFAQGKTHHHLHHHIIHQHNYHKTHHYHHKTIHPHHVSGKVSWQNNKIQRVIKTAYAQLGKPYEYASSGPNEFDCSGLTKYTYAKIGIHIPHHASSQMHCGRYVAYSEIRPGDLVFFRHAGHVGIYLGNDKFIHAPKTGESIRIDKLSLSQDYYGARRIIQSPIHSSNNLHKSTHKHVIHT